jgi:hypothetical protein
MILTTRVYLRLKIGPVSAPRAQRRIGAALYSAVRPRKSSEAELMQ